MAGSALAVMSVYCSDKSWALFSSSTALNSAWLVKLLASTWSASICGKSTSIFWFKSLKVFKMPSKLRILSSISILVMAPLNCRLVASKMFFSVSFCWSLTVSNWEFSNANLFKAFKRSTSADWLDDWTLQLYKSSSLSLNSPISFLSKSNVLFWTFIGIIALLTSSSKSVAFFRTNSLRSRSIEVFLISPKRLWASAKAESILVLAAVSRLRDKASTAIMASWAPETVESTLSFKPVIFCNSLLAMSRLSWALSKVKLTCFV